MESRTQWRGERDTTRARLWRLLALSVVLHAPLTPVAALIGLLSLLGRQHAEAPPPADPITAIPVDLVAGEGPGEAPAGAVPAPGSASGAEKPASTADPFSDLDREKDEAPAANPPPVEPEQRDGGAGDAGRAGPIGDPVALAGSAGRIADANANVRVLIFADRIRNHPLGVRIGELLGAAEQWQDFFGPTGLDPIQDVDRILIAGPQLRDSAEVVAVLDVNVPADRLRTAVDALARRDQSGGWLDAGVPAARVHADRADRLFVIPAPNLLVVAPPSAHKHALSLGSGLKFPNPKGNEAVTAYVVSPWRALHGLPFELAKSIKWVRLKVTPTSDGGATAEIVAEDESAEAAKQHAEELTKTLDAVTQQDLGAIPLVGKLSKLFGGGGKIRLLEPVVFTASGSEIRGTVVATPKQLGTLLEAIAGYAKMLAEEAKKKKAAADAGAPAADGAAPASTVDAATEARAADRSSPSPSPSSKEP